MEEIQFWLFTLYFVILNSTTLNRFIPFEIIFLRPPHHTTFDVAINLICAQKTVKFVNTGVFIQFEMLDNLKFDFQ